MKLFVAGCQGWKEEMAGGAGEEVAEGLREEGETGEEGRLPEISAGEVIHSDNGDLSYRIISQVRSSHTLICCPLCGSSLAEM